VNDEQLRQQAAHKERSQAMLIAQGVVAKTMDRLRACHDRGNVPSGKSVVRVSVHRSGYITATSIEGVGASVRDCVERELQKERVPHHLGQSFVFERELTFKADGQ
jgi:hypothetical protein